MFNLTSEKQQHKRSGYAQKELVTMMFCLIISEDKSVLRYREGRDVIIAQICGSWRPLSGLSWKTFIVPRSVVHVENKRNNCKKKEQTKWKRSKPPQSGCWRTKQQSALMEYADTFTPNHFIQSPRFTAKCWYVQTKHILWLDSEICNSEKSSVHQAHFWEKQIKMLLWDMDCVKSC